MTSCQKLDRVKRKAGISRSSASSAHSKHAHGNTDRQEIHRPSPSLCSSTTTAPPNASSLSTLLDRKNDVIINASNSPSCETVKPCNHQGLFQSLHTFSTHKAALGFTFMLLSRAAHRSAIQSKCDGKMGQKPSPGLACVSVRACIWFTHRGKAARTTRHKVVTKS